MHVGRAVGNTVFVDNTGWWIAGISCRWIGKVCRHGASVPCGDGWQGDKSYSNMICPSWRNSFQGPISSNE
jgi:hypothetical protein